MKLMEFLLVQNLSSTLSTFQTDFIFVPFSFFFPLKEKKKLLRGENKDKKAREEILFRSNVLFSMTA